MKKVFLFLTMLLFAFTGTMKAGVEVEVGKATSNNSYLPDYTYYNYAVSQQIYTASEIGMGGTITAISFDVNSGSATRALKVYMKHVTKSTFAGTTVNDWAQFDPADVLFVGDVTWGAGWKTITLDTPFEYNGTDNLLVCVQDETGSYVSSQSFKVYSSSNASLRVYRDGSPYDISNLSGGSRVSYKSHIKLTMELGPAAISATPNPVAMGLRPSGAWMEPMTFNLNNTGNDAAVSMIEVSDPFFTIGTQAPFVVRFGEPKPITVSTGTASAGEKSAQIMIAYNDRSFTLVDVTANVYAPAATDVVETAETVTEFPFNATVATSNEGIQQNYNLTSGGGTIAKDVVYKVTMANDVLFTATATDGIAVLYAENFGGEAGPMATNSIASGNIDMYLPAGTYYVVFASATENFEVAMTTAPAPAPLQPAIVSPVDGATGVDNGNTFSWTLGDYTQEYQVLLGTVYPPTEPYIAWTSELATSTTFEGLQHNKIYFAQVLGRNSTGTTASEIIGFTTVINPVTGFAAAATELYPGEAAEFTWNANRSIKGYNFYKDGVKLNEALLTTAAYTVEGLEYNILEGYNFQVSAVYDEGESALTPAINIKMTGLGTISGTVYEQDSTTVIPNATVQIVGKDEYNVAQVFTFATDANGAYEGDVYAGAYKAYASKDGYQVCAGDNALVLYNMETENVNVILHEFYYPLGQIAAEVVEDNVDVTWSWTPGEYVIDFETGQMPEEFTSTSTYPWVITTTNPHEGTYCIKSTCESIASATSDIEATVDVPFEAKMGFWVRVSSESNYDKFHFYIDGVEQGAAISGQQPYAYKEYTVSEGTHTYKWAYQKDSSVNSNDDCVYVDDITMYRKDEPLPPIPGATLYNFDDNTMMGWTSIDADGDGNGWVSSSNPGIYHNSGVNLSGTGHNSSEAYVISGSYANQTGAALTPDNYLVSPTVISAQAGAAISFWACAQDASYAAEHFGVAVSTTTATAGAFTTIQEWTMTAKRNVMMAEEAPRAVRGTRQGTWYEYNVDLSSYAGQDIWVAIRHFNCTDQFILNVDDITLGDGSAKDMAKGNRSLNSFNLYRKNINVEEPVEELIATLNDTTFSYTDAEWDSLSYGVYQWGIQAYYEGNAPAPDMTRDELTVFDGITTNGYVPVYGFYADAYLKSEMVYPASEIGAMTGSNINGMTFYATQANVNWGVANFQVFMTEVNDATISAFVGPDAATVVYEGELSVVDNTMVVNFTTPYTYGGGNLLVGFYETATGSYVTSTWNGETVTGASLQGYSYTSLAAVSGTQRNFLPKTTFNYAASASAYNGLSDILWSNSIEKDMYAAVTVNVTLNNGQLPTGAAVAITGDNTYTATADETGTVVFDAVRKGDYVVTVSLDGYTTYTTDAAIVEPTATFDALLEEVIAPVGGFYVSPTGYAMWNGNQPGPGPTPGGLWYQYDDGVCTNHVGLGGGQFYFGVMFPAGSYTGNTVTKVAAFDAAGYTMTGSVTIYNGGTSAPGTAVGTMPITFTGVDDFVEFTFATPVTIDPSQNLWVIIDNESGTDYPAACSNDVTNDPNGRWIGLSGQWYDMATIGVPGATLMVRAYVASGKGEVQEISVPTKNYPGNHVVAKAETINRAPLKYKIMLDGTLVGETTDDHYQFDVTGMEEGSEHVASIAAVYTTGMGDYVDYNWIYAGCGAYAQATEFVGESSAEGALLSWTLGTNPGPGPNPGPGGTTSYDFDNGTFQGWTTIDANNDGYDWVLGSQIGGVYLASGASLSGSGHNSSTDLVCSGSYSNATSAAITPDNYLVSPAKGRYHSITFYACAQDASYAAEHYGVAVSTGSASASDFTMVQEWTMTAKDQGAMSVGRDGQTRAQGSWYEKTVDLSAYAGQDIWVAIRHFNCNDQFILNIDDITLTAPAKAERSNRDMWDLVFSFEGTSGYQYGVASDGNNIYTSSWSSSSSSMFYKYDMEGNFIEEFNISGCGQLRGMTYDGQYFYGVANAATVYCVDLANHTLVSQFTTSYGAMRCITYDPQRDGFWVVGNWTGNLTLIDRTGAIVQAAGAPTSASDVAYFKDSENVEHIFYLKNATGGGEVYEYNITTGTMGTTPVFDCTTVTGAAAWTGSSGGCFVGTYGDKVCLFADAQQSPQLINIYELEAGSGPTPPQPVGDVLGVNLYRDGEFLAYLPAVVNAYVDAVPEGEYNYCLEVVYADYGMACPQCIDVTVAPAPCDPVTNLTAYQTEYQGAAAIRAEWDAMPNAVKYEIYLDGEVLGQISGNAVTIHNNGTPLPSGEYTIGVVVIYSHCESDMAETTVNIVDAVDENEIVSAIYPNPTSGDLSIKAAGMTHVSVFNAMGQMVYDQAVDADELVLNMGQYEAGVYMVRIDTENGSSVKRITVVK